MPSGTGANTTVIAFDFGLRHIGVAVGQTITETASPISTIGAQDGKPGWGAIDELIGAWSPGLLLVGLPLNMDGTESDMSAQARRFVRRLEARFRLPVMLVDERLTSYEAAQTIAPEDLRSHALAAVLIAESWLRNRDCSPPDPAATD